MAAVQSTAREPGSPTAAASRLSSLLGWLRLSICEAIGRADIRMAARLDELNDAQLREIGVRRIRRSVRWPENIECEYHLLTDERCHTEG
jgi:hypothetical protein